MTLMASCTTLQYKQQEQKVLPELGTIGMYADYLLENDHQSKTVVSLTEPVRLQVSEVRISKRELFTKEGETKADSIHLSLEILDKIGLVHQMNSNLELLKYLKRADGYELVTQVNVYFPAEIRSQITASDEVYLVQNKERTLSLELRNDNVIAGTVEFTQGNITRFKAASFCWGKGDRGRIEIFDLIPSGAACSEDTYRTARKAEKKNEFKF